MENNYSTIQTLVPAFTIPADTSAIAMPIAMPMAGCAFGSRQESVSIDRRIETTDVRTRKAAVQGHLGLVAFVPGYPAWSPPIC